MDYATLKASAANWLARSDITDAELSLMVMLAEARIYRRLRLAEMETVFFSPLDADAKAAVPSDYLAFKEVGLYEGAGDTSTLLSFATATRVARLQRTSGEELFDAVTANRGGVPSKFARIGQSFVVAPIPNGTYSLGGIYFARPAALSDLAPTNTLMDRNPDLFLFAVTLEAAIFTRHPSIEMYGTRVDGLIDAVQLADEMERSSGTQVVTMSGVR